MLSKLKSHRIEFFLAAVALLPHLVIALGNPNTVLDWYSSDDGFYYFQVARNLAAGKGFTFDGLTQTNGFHPLWLFLITPIFALARLDLLLPLRLLVLLMAAVNAGTAILLFRLLRGRITPNLAAAVGLLWLVLPPIHFITAKAGVEAGLNAFFIALFWRRLTAFLAEKHNRPKTLRQLPILGLIAALTLFSRLDNLFLVFFGGLWLWLRLWQPADGKASTQRQAWRWRLSTGLVFFGPITLIMLAYLAWNKLGFGTFIPVSGQIKVWWGTLRNTVYGFPVRRFGTYLGQLVTADPELGPWSLATAPLYAAAEGLLGAFSQGVTVAARRVLLLGMGGLLAALGGALLWVRRTFFLNATRQLGLGYFLIACLAQISYYKLGGSLAQQPWYWVAESLLLLIGLGLLLEGGRRWLLARWPGLGARRGAAPAGLAAALILVSHLAYIGAAIRAPGDGRNHFYLARPAWLISRTEEDAVVAITGAGNLGYFTEGRAIVNMDGLMNSYDYFRHLQAGTGAQYLAELGVDYIFGNEYIYSETNPYGPMLEGHLQLYAVFEINADRELLLWRFIP